VAGDIGSADDLSDVTLADITQVSLGPAPDGPQPPVFPSNPTGDDRPLSQILPYVPLPLPEQIPQDCGEGGILVITLRDGREISYGPCKRPVEIDRLWWHYLDVMYDGE